MFIQNIATKPEKKTDDGNTISLVLPFKDQIAANSVRRQLRDLSNKIAITLQPPLMKKCGRGASVNSLKPARTHKTVILTLDFSFLLPIQLIKSIVVVSVQLLF